MTEPIHVSAHTVAPRVDLDVPEPAATPPTPPTTPTTSATPTSAASPSSVAPPPSSPATQLLVQSHSLLPTPSTPCLEQAAAAAKGAGVLATAVGALAASGTAGPIGAFIGASIIFGALAAQYYNCEVAAAEAASKRQP